MIKLRRQIEKELKKEGIAFDMNVYPKHYEIVLEDNQKLIVYKDNTYCRDFTTICEESVIHKVENILMEFGFEFTL